MLGILYMWWISIPSRGSSNTPSHVILALQWWTSIPFMSFFSSDDLQDIRNEIEREEEKVQTGPPRTKGEVLVKVCVLSFFISDKHFYLHINKIAVTASWTASMNFLSESKVYERHRKGDMGWYTTEPRKKSNLLISLTLSLFSAFQLHKMNF